MFLKSKLSDHSSQNHERIEELTMDFNQQRENGAEERLDERRRSNRLRNQIRRSEETEEERNQRRSEERDRHRQRREAQTENERDRRRQIERDRIRLRRAEEEADEIELRRREIDQERQFRQNQSTSKPLPFYKKAFIYDCNSMQTAIGFMKLGSRSKI